MPVQSSLLSPRADATGDVAGYQQVGGLVGHLSATSKINHSFSTGSINSDGTNAESGGLLGQYGSGSDPNGTTLNNVHYFNQADDVSNCWSQNTPSAGDTNCTAQTPISYFHTSTNEPYNTGSWDTTTIWQFSGSANPTLR